MNPLLDASKPIVDKDGTMSMAFRNWTLKASLSVIMEGTGSPEGVVNALPKQLYMDMTGTAGSVLYIKQLPDIGGDTSQGWLLV